MKTKLDVDAQKDLDEIRLKIDQGKGLIEDCQPFSVSELGPASSGNQIKGLDGAKDKKQDEFESLWNRRNGPM